MGEDVRAHLAAAGVTVHVYSSFATTLATIVAGHKVMVEKGNCSMGMITSMALSTEEVKERVKEVVNSPIQHMKACKNSAEIEGLRYYQTNIGSTQLAESTRTPTLAPSP